jgi:hypothetical protein
MHSPTSHFLRHGKRFIFHSYQALRIGPGAPAIVCLVLLRPISGRADLEDSRRAPVTLGWLRIGGSGCASASISPPLPTTLSPHRMPSLYLPNNNAIHINRVLRRAHTIPYLAPSVWAATYHLSPITCHPAPSAQHPAPSTPPAQTQYQPDLRPHRPPWRP